MNCPSRVDPEALPNGWNQNPDAFALQSNNEFSNRANLTHSRDHRIPLEQPPKDALDQDSHVHDPSGVGQEPDRGVGSGVGGGDGGSEEEKSSRSIQSSPGNAPTQNAPSLPEPSTQQRPISLLQAKIQQVWAALRKYVRFIGPGFMVAVAYIDPGADCYYCTTVMNSDRPLQATTRQTLQLERHTDSNCLS